MNSDKRERETEEAEQRAFIKFSLESRWNGIALMDYKKCFMGQIQTDITHSSVFVGFEIYPTFESLCNFNVL